MIGISKAEFEQIFSELYYPLRNFLFYKSGNSEMSEDIAQDAFLKLWEKRDGIKKQTVKPLLYSIANNLFLNKVEHNKVVLRFEQYYQPGKITEGPDFEMEMKEFDQRLQNALSELDEKKRTVFLMNRIDGFTYREISESLDITVKAVEKRMEKALAFLKQKVEVNL